MTKDLVLAGDTTIVLILSPAELDTLYAYYRDLRIDTLPEPHPAIDPMSIMMPMFTTRLRIRSGGREREFIWESGRDPVPASALEWQRLHRFVTVVRRVVQERPEYRALPAPTGGYM